MTKFISETLTDALRHNQTENIKFNSPYEACIFPLLRALGWHNYARDLIEALPHYSQQLDLVDLRNILVSVGYESHVQKTSLHKIKKELYPCLFISNKNDVYVLIEKRDNEFVYYDANEGREYTDKMPRLKGTVYFFTDTNPTHGISSKDNISEEWFDRLFKRFKHMITHLLAMTFIINLIALLIPIFIMIVYDKVIGTKSIETLPFLLSGVSILMITDLMLRLLKSRLLGALAGRIDWTAWCWQLQHRY